MELRRESALPKPTKQTNVSFSRQGVIRGLHYHERGQDDLFVCMQGTARVVVLDRESGETFTEDIGDENPVAIYVPGRNAHGFEALTDLFFCYHVTEEYDPANPDEQGICWADPRVKHLWSTDSPTLSPRDLAGACTRGDHAWRRRRQLGRALTEEFAGDELVALSHADWDVSLPPPPTLDRPDLVLHTAAWTDVDGAEDDPQGAVGGQRRRDAERRVARRSDRLLLDRLRLRRRQARAVRRVRRPESPVRLRALEASRRGRRRRAARGSSARPGSSARRATTSSARCSGSEQSGRRWRSSTTSEARRRSSAISPPRRVSCSSSRTAIWHVAAAGDCTWADFAEAIFEEAGLSCRVRRISTAELGRPAPRPAYSVLRSERPVRRSCRTGARVCARRLQPSAPGSRPNNRPWRATPS